ncbi:putative ABC-type Fe3+ transport system periplasmic component-like protein [Desulfosarcina cetonica]|uniref:ABC transporter substrate-binding protein n=1 Tax=Desulfosarcina cetonica TaxID=90730 RepID=UPI0006D0C0A6|nr:ABC transporter substrate-binding protein [Desulfosarcina cetonica]VTR71086.1 putative ABC-type Fe3+ transport system periplasmic component-like protein [Desulfosarcina cetonica]
MASILLHCPLNISRSLGQMIDDFCRTWQEKHGIEVTLQTQPHRPDEASLFQTGLDEGQFPDLTLGHVNDFADLPDGYLQTYFSALPDRFPLRTELVEQGFRDPAGYFHPFVVIPFAIFYNHQLIGADEIPRRWEDLLDPQWHQKILMPDVFRVVSKVIHAFMQADFPDGIDPFRQNAVCKGAPPEVVTAVDEGRYPLGITNIAFARVSRHKNTRVIWPADGLFCMPQVMVFSRQAPDAMLEIGDFLMSPTVQDYFSLQSFVPAAPNVSLHSLVAENHCHLRWKNWPAFLEAVGDKQ